jgi:hypothetical protein
MGKLALLVGSASILFVGVAMAGQPDSPGVFGRDRAAYAHGAREGGVNDTGAPGASEVGKITSERAGENGAINRAYKDANGGSPNPQSDNGSGNDNR